MNKFDLTIDLPMDETPLEKDIQKKFNTLILDDNWLTLKASFKCKNKKEIDDLTWKDEIHWYQHKVKRTAIMYIGMAYRNFDDVFSVRLEGVGLEGGLGMFFRDKKEAQKVFDILDKWINM